MAQGSARASVPSSSYSEEHEQNEHAWHLQYGQWCSLWSAEQKAWQSANIRSPSRPELQMVYVPPAAMVAPVAKVSPYSNSPSAAQPLLQRPIE